MKRVIFRLFYFILSCTTFYSCSEQELPDLPEGSENGNTQQEMASIDQTQIAAKGGSFIVRISTSETWRASSSESWCTLSKLSGNGSGTVIGVVKANTGAERRVVITIAAGEKVKELTLKQLAGDDSQPTPDPEPGPDPTPEPERPSGYAGRIEIPALSTGTGYKFVTHTTIENNKEVITYSYEYDCNKMHSRWVACTFSTATPDNNVGRNENFTEDPLLPVAYQLGAKAFSGSGYSRGHLIASGDRQYSVAANKKTFYMSNMSPQIQNGFNGGIWASLENKVQSKGHGISNSKDTLYVVKGGTIKEEQIEKYISDGTHRIPVPKYYFMALLSLKNGQYSAIGYWLEHKSYSNNDFSNYEVTIDELEEKTGIDFFCNLPSDIEKSVEQSKSNWTW